MNLIKAKVTVDSSSVGTNWAKATTFAGSVSSACAAYGKDYKFYTAIVGERKTVTVDDGTTSPAESLEVSSEIRFADSAWASIQGLENKIQNACTVAGGTKNYKIQTYAEK